MNKKYDIFISYSSKDLEKIKELAMFVETIGHKCWYSDRDLDKGRSDWMEVLMNTLNQSDKVILFVTKNAIESGEVKNEIANASANGLNVIPIIAQDVKIPDAFLYFIRKYEWINAYDMEERSVADIIRERLFENINKIRDDFWKTLQSQEYKNFETTVMERYYGTRFFTKINHRDFAVFCVPGRPASQVQSIKDFDYICDSKGSELSDFDICDHQKYTQNKWYAEYSSILEGKIRYPNRPGYMLDEIFLDTEGYLEKIRVHVGTFAENVYSTHILEYELYKAFCDYFQKDLSDAYTWNQLQDSLTIRNKMHEDVFSDRNGYIEERMFRSLLKGINRDSLLSVQMMVIIKSKRTHKYEVKIVQRSRNVVIKPGIYQCIPSGGFEILNDSDDNIYDDLELEENFSPGCAIFREYLEELFNIPEFEGGGTGSVEERLLKDPRIIEIETMLAKGTAEFQFLGSVIDLAGLRHELSFVLVISDEGYSETQFLANEECKKGAVHSIPLQDFENKDSIWNMLHGPSAAMWHLFKQTHLYQSLMDS